MECVMWMVVYTIGNITYKVHGFEYKIGAQIFLDSMRYKGSVEPDDLV